MQNVIIVKEQIKKVIDKVIEKKNIREHEFLDTLLKRLENLLSAVDTESFKDIRKNSGINGALRAYFDTNLVEGYDEPLVIELDKLEMMLK
ncbi:hypothetical protein [Fictibacillus barbaricus]|uniref:Uncharacterized protein n=1 Tax=Fictibacillus barbaricus TaxID=182136 RepID=A0ABS2Z882_9BACL|nr:hypothetical protein [Fictibacillus barbaricus]MBN3544323.1 hypothetical protein [Fictibacillus barbaricus]GGB67781.1 hypothetical protein GCM10007199_37400 [Fictibacillus barbaricus]